MDKSKKHLHYLDDLSGYKVKDEDPDVRGWKVLDASHQKIGKVQNFLVSKEAKKVRYLNVEVDKDIIAEGHEPLSGKVDSPHEFINRDGDTNLIIPIEMATIDEEEKAVYTADVSRETFARTKRIAPAGPVSPEYERYVLQNYRGEKPA